MDGACLVPELAGGGPGPGVLPWRRADRRILDLRCLVVRWLILVVEVTFTLVKLIGLMGKCLDPPVFIARAQECSRNGVL